MLGNMKHIVSMQYGGQSVVIYLDNDGFARAKSDGIDIHESGLSAVFGKAFAGLVEERDQLQRDVARYQERIAKGELIEP